MMIGVIPAAGSGKRLLPFTRAVPKEMYPILGKTPLDYALESMQKVGIKKVFIIVGHKKGAIIDYVGDGSRYGLKAIYVYQEQQLGLGHAILQVADLVDTTFLVIFGDTIITPYTEIKQLINMHKSHSSQLKLVTDHHSHCINLGDSIATILLNEVLDPSEYGVAKIENDKILELKEKPNESERRYFESDGKYLVISGAYILEPEIFNYLKDTNPGHNNEIQLTDAVEYAIRSGKNVYGYVLNGQRHDIGKWSTLIDVERSLICDTL